MGYHLTMAIDFGALKQPRTADKLIDPRDIFNALPAKKARNEFPPGPTGSGPREVVCSAVTARRGGQTQHRWG